MWIASCFKCPWFKPKFGHIYYALAAVNLATLAVSLILGNYLLAGYSHSARMAQRYLQQQSRCLELMRLAADVGAPAGGLLQSRDIVAERLRLDRSVDGYHEAAAKVRASFSQPQDPSPSPSLTAWLDEADAHFRHVQEEARLIFAALETGDRERAGDRMAVMDRSLAHARDSLVALCQSSGLARDQEVAAEIARANSLGLAHHCLVAGAAIVVLLVSWYGHRLAQRLATQQQELRHHDERLQGLVNSAADAIITINEDCRIVSFNPAAERMFGYAADEALGQNVKLLIPEPDRERHDEQVGRYLRTGERRIIGIGRETQAVRKDGSVFPIEISVCETRLPQGRLFTGILRDICERKRAEAEIQRQQAELTRYVGDVEAARRILEDRTAELNTAQEVLLEQCDELKARAGDLRQAQQRTEEASRSKSEFLANMSHEIRTPMTAILGYAENLLCPDLSPHDRTLAVQTIRRNGEHLLEIINDILDVSKIEAGKLEVERIPCSLVQILADVASLMRVRADAKKLSLSVEYQSAVPETIHSDPTRFRQILINLVGNAIKFTQRGSVRLAARVPEREAAVPVIQIDVTDTGIGMTREQTDRLFQPFTQADSSTTRRFGGTGLGLTISQRLAEMLGGSIAATSQPGKGATFSLTLPTGSLEGVTWLSKPGEAVVQLSNRHEASPQFHAQTLDCRVLLAEDGPDNQRLISFLLQKAGAEVTIVDNGHTALECALEAAGQGQPFDLILMDMQMPVMDGYAAASTLRQRGYGGPIVALTAHAMSGDREKCLAAGCDDFATKPIDRAQLLRTVARHTTTPSRSTTSGFGKPVRGA